jgi:hypothetical protein
MRPRRYNPIPMEGFGNQLLLAGYSLTCNPSKATVPDISIVRENLYTLWNCV